MHSTPKGDIMINDIVEKTLFNKPEEKVVKNVADSIDQLVEYFNPKEQEKIRSYENWSYYNSFSYVKDYIDKANEIKENDVENIVDDFLMNYIKDFYGSTGEKFYNGMKEVNESSKLSREEKRDFFKTIVQNLVGIRGEEIEEIINDTKEYLRNNTDNGNDDLKLGLFSNLESKFGDFLRSHRFSSYVMNRKVSDLIDKPEFYMPNVLKQGFLESKYAQKHNYSITDDEKALLLLPRDIPQIAQTLAQMEYSSFDYMKNKGLGLK